MKNNRGGKRSKPAGRNTSKPMLVNVGSLNEIQFNKKRMAEFRHYHWWLQSELASQRNKVQDEIKIALLSMSSAYNAKQLQRAVKYKYALHPLSVIGSKRDVGGRFNIGSNVNQECLPFAGLYLAQDKDTALQEHLGQVKTNLNSGLSSREIALTNPASEVIVSVSIKLDKVFDLTELKNLTPFTKIIKGFLLSKDLLEFGKKLGVNNPGMVTSNKLLQTTLLDPEWRRLPNLYDLPSNSQIFGHLVYLAGIEGILYTSKLTGKKCVVIFPDNFAGTDSFISLDDEPPNEYVPSRIDSGNLQLCNIDYDAVKAQRNL